MKRIVFLCAILLCYSVYSQITPVPTLYSTADSYTFSFSPNNNSGSATTMNVAVSTRGYQRSFLMFDFSSIPSDAVITSAILKLTPSGTENVAANSTELYLDACNSAWQENTISHSSNISENTIFATVTNSNYVSGKREFQVKDHVQAMVELRLPNYGWRIRRADETALNSSIYFTKEDATISNRPQLEIQYYRKSYISTANIIHTSSLNSTDASISPTIAYGSSESKTFRWYNSSGTQIGTTQNLTGIGKGWYGLKYYGTTAGDTTYQAFFVGTECEDVSITFDPGPNYIDDARPTDFVNGTGNAAIRYSQTNSPVNPAFVAERWTNSGTWYGFRSLIKFRLWIDPACQVNTANMTLTGNAHNPLSVSNSSELLRNTSYWTESGVAFTNIPTNTTTGKINLASITGNTNATIDIASFFNTWKTDNPNNHGLLFQLQAPAYTTDSYTRMQFHSSDAAVAANRPRISFSIKVNTCELGRKGTITATDNEPALKTNVTVGITPPSWAQSPYRYEISGFKIPEPRVLLKYLNDSLFDPDIDSTSFYRGITSSLTNNFGELEYGTYYIAAFDNTGKRIFDKSVDLYPNLTLLTNSNVTLNGNEIMGNSASSRCEISAFVNSSIPDCSVKFNLSSISGNQYYGFLDVAKTLSTATDIAYGFVIKNGTCRTIFNSAELGTSFTILPGKDLKISFSDGFISYHYDNVLLTKLQLNAGYTLKTGAVLNASSRTFIRITNVVLRPFFIFQPSNISRTCSATNYDLTFRVSPILSSQFGSYTYKLSYYNGNGLVLAMNSSASNNNLYTIPNVWPGVYTLTCTQNSGTSPIQLVNTVYVGTQTEWFSTHPNYNLTPNTYSLNRDNLAQGTYSKAMSTNILPAATSGWAWFNPICIGTNNLMQGNILSLATNSNLLPSPNDVYLNFKKTGTNQILSIPPGSTLLLWGDKLPNGNTVTGATFVPANPFVSLQFDASVMKIYVRSGTYSVTLNQPAGNIRLKANSMLPGEGFSNVHSTFPCGINQKLSEVSHYELSRDYTAGYATAVEGKLKFTFDEEYSIQSNKNLPYVIFNDANNPIASWDPNGSVTGGATALTYSFDDNRYTLTIPSGAVPGKFYHLEVTTSTGQKRVLRFLFKY